MSNATSARRVRVEQGIYRRPDGRLEIGWRDARGKQCWRVVEGTADGKGITLARKALTKECAKRANGEVAAADPRLSFNAAADVWWVRVERMRPATQNAYGSGLKHLRAHFGSQRMARITTTDVARYVSIKQKEGLKGWTIKGHLTVLSAIFRHASRHLGLATPNPVGLLDRVERPKMDDAKVKRILTPSERAALIESVDDHHRPLFRLAAETGCRLGEALGLTWQDIDLAGQSITFTCQLDRYGKRVPLKTARSRRCIEVTPDVAADLRKLKLAAGDVAPDALVFVRRLTGKGHDHRNIGGRVLTRAIAKAGLAAPAPTFHDLRHSHASALIAAGFDIEEVRARLGHEDATTTLRIYAHEFDVAHRSDDRRARLAALYGSAMEAPSSFAPSPAVTPEDSEAPNRRVLSEAA